MSGRTKKQLILEIFDQQSMTTLGEFEVKVIQKQLNGILGEAGKSSRSYIARVLAAAGKPVQIIDSFTLPLLPEPYNQMFKGLLHFGTLEQAELSLRQMSAFYERFKAMGDEKGMAYARTLVLVGKRRAQAAANRSKSPDMRDLKREIAEWFALWLSAPSLFSDWLFLRKQSPSFKQKWGATQNLVEDQTEPLSG
jgi:hypothetical protein